MSDQSTTQCFESGAVRSVGCALEKAGRFPARFDLVSPIGLRRVAEAYGEGAQKYEPGNWTKGIPESSLVQHAQAHIMAYLMGDTSEDHIGHAIWNLMTLAHNQEQRPDLMDLGPVRRGNALSENV
jgi:hypothetical protein